MEQYCFNLCFLITLESLYVLFHAADMMVHLVLACCATALSYPATEASLVLSAELPVSFWSVLCVHIVLHLHAWAGLNF